MTRRCLKSQIRTFDLHSHVTQGAESLRCEWTLSPKVSCWAAQVMLMGLNSVCVEALRMWHLNPASVNDPLLDPPTSHDLKEEAILSAGLLLFNTNVCAVKSLPIHVRARRPLGMTIPQNKSTPPCMTAVNPHPPPPSLQAHVATLSGPLLLLDVYTRFKQQLNHQSERRKYGWDCWVREKQVIAWQREHSIHTKLLWGRTTSLLCELIFALSTPLKLTVSVCLTLQVKVWFQNRRMKWKRVKGGQQGAAAREKELVNVKKGTLLPSEFSGIAALHHSTDSLPNEDSHDSDQSSEHAHLWCTHTHTLVRRAQALPLPQDCPYRDWAVCWFAIVIQRC